VVVVDDWPRHVDVNELTVECRVNGEVRQRGSTAEMTFGIDETATYLARFLTRCAITAPSSAVSGAAWTPATTTPGPTSSRPARGH
jgi:hypothetical protein